MRPVIAALFIILPALAQTQVAEPANPEMAKLKIALDRAERTLKDWPNLTRYRAENAKVAPPLSGEERVVLFGDSITDSWGRKYGRFFPGKPYLNRGISGQTTPQMLLRFRSDVLAHQPRVVVILAGTNDIAGNTGPMTLDEIGKNLMSIAELARVHGVAVVFSSLLPVCDYIRPQTERRPPEKIRELNAWLREYCRKSGHVYLDYYSAMVDEQQYLKRELTYDGLHPNDEGYAVMQPLAEQAIARALANRN